MRSAGIIAIALSAFGATVLLVDYLLPARDLPWMVREKVAHLAAHGGEYDAIFLGSSRIQNNIIPSLFDRTAAEHGMAIRSFNAGISGMYPPHDAYFLDRILASKPARVRWIFVELQYLQTSVPRANRDTLEEVYWHDWPRFSLMGRRLFTTKKRKHWRDELQEAVERWPNIGIHALLFVKNVTNLGRGSLLLNRWLTHEAAAPFDWRLLGEYRDGWLPAGVGERRDAATLASLEDDLAQRRRVPPTKDSDDPVTQNAFDAVIAKIRQAGATPVLVVPPNAARGAYYYPPPKRAEQLIILDFCDPRKYPELYETRYRVDTSHLTPPGAEIFTRLLAERFLEATGH